MKIRGFLAGLGAALLFSGCNTTRNEALKAEAESLKACGEMVGGGLLPIAATRDQRFEGKVQEATARCRGGATAVQFRLVPWVDWSNYWGAGDSSSQVADFVKSAGLLGPNMRGLNGALLDLEYQRIELIKFNLFDNNGSYQEYVTGRQGTGGAALKVWDAMRLPKSHPNYRDVGGDAKQLCSGELIRSRTLSGICNDIRN